MSSKKKRSDAQGIIQSLETGRYALECPCCGDEHVARDVGLFYLDDFSEEGEELLKLRKKELRDAEKELSARRKKIPNQSESLARATNLGFILERIAPAMDGFGFERNDCRSLFDPIDYVIFEGLSRKGRVTRIIISEIKSGRNPLSPRQKEIRTLVDKKKVEFQLYSPRRMV